MSKFDLIYLFGFSPNEEKKLRDLVPLIRSQLNANGGKIGLVLIHDGVIGTSDKGLTPKSLKLALELPISLFVMSPDLKARGIAVDSIQEGITPLEYDDLVDILDDTPKLVSWM